MTSAAVEQAARTSGLSLAPAQFEQLRRYRDLILEANQGINLTAVTNADLFDRRMIGETLTLAQLLPAKPGRLLDVGTGGGVPGIPLAIVRPDLEVHLLDATAKKLAVLSEIAATLQLTNLQIIHGRAEEIANQPKSRGCYTFVVARAVAPLATLVELTLPFLEVGGLALFPKGQNVYDESRTATAAITALGGRFVDVFESSFDDSRIVRIAQINLSPARYPRRPGVPARKPIGVSTR